MVGNLLTKKETGRSAMSIAIPRPTDDIRNALKDGLDPFLDHKDPLRQILIGAQSGELAAVPTYRVKLEDVASGNWQQRQLTGWRFLAVDPDKHGIVVDVKAPALGHPPRVGGVQRNPQVAKTIEALRAVEAPTGTAPDDVELYFLNIPGLLTETFWIKPKNNIGEGWAVPYRTLVPDFQTKSLFPLEEFFKTAKSLAQERIKQNDDL